MLARVKCLAWVQVMEIEDEQTMTKCLHQNRTMHSCQAVLVRKTDVGKHATEVQMLGTRIVLPTRVI